MTLLKLAIRNLIGAGLRTVLNVLVLALTFLAIVASLGLLEGMNEQTSRAMVEAEYGGGFPGGFPGGFGGGRGKGKGKGRRR